MARYSNVMIRKEIAVIGAGMAGLSCADALADAGASVTVFEKSGDIGGRLASRRRQGASWNHGAPAVEVRGADFGAFASRLNGVPVSGDWSAAGGTVTIDSGERRIAGAPDMRELLRPLAARLDIRCNARISRLSRSGSRHLLIHAAEGQQPRAAFDAVVCAQPAPQVREVLDRSGIASPPALGAVVMAPCWVLLLGFAEPWPALGELAPSRVIERAIPQRAVPSAASRVRHRWVVHAGSDWSRQHLELDRDEAAARMLGALTRTLGEPPPVGYLAAHRWRYARARVTLEPTHLWQPDAGLGFAGDWCAGGDAEGAYRSGAALARAMISDYTS